MLEDYSASCPWAVFPRKKLDVTYSDIVAGLRGCLSLSESQRDEYLTSIARHWDPSGDAMVTLSVRYVAPSPLLGHTVLRSLIASLQHGL
jgi:hypothetical protein